MHSKEAIREAQANSGHGKLVRVRFTSPVDMYNPGETAGFEPAKAQRLIAHGVAELVDEAAKAIYDKKVSDAGLSAPPVMLRPNQTAEDVEIERLLASMDAPAVQIYRDWVNVGEDNFSAITKAQQGLVPNEASNVGSATGSGDATNNMTPRPEDLEAMRQNARSESERSPDQVKIDAEMAQRERFVEEASGGVPQPDNDPDAVVASATP